MTNSERELLIYEAAHEDKISATCSICGCRYDRHFWGIDTGIVKGCPCGKCKKGLFSPADPEKWNAAMSTLA